MLVKHVLQVTETTKRKRMQRVFCWKNSEVIPGKWRSPSVFRVPPGLVACLEEVCDIHENEGDRELKMC